MLVLLAGCGRSSAPDYGNGRNTAMLDACEAMVQGRDADAEAALKVLEEYSGSDDFASSARLSLQRRMNFAMAGKYLEQSDFQGLRVFLAECNASGSAGAELDGFDMLPDALEALAIFKSRLPWEEAKVLKDSLEDLEPHRALLSKSAVFTAFYNEQLETLKKLQASEASAEAESYLDQIERAIVSGNTQKLSELKTDFRRVQPGHGLFACEKALLSGKALPEMNGTDMRILAIAAAANWSKLSGTTRGALAKSCESDEKSGICGKMLNTLNSNSLEKYENFICTARDGGYSLSSELVRRYIRMLKPEVPGGLTPCTGLSELGKMCNMKQ